MSGEQDPTGRSAHQPGAKLDAGKVRAGLVMGGFSRALWAVAQVGTFGARKYTPNGWRSVPEGIERYTDALERHRLLEAMGQANDEDSGLLHAAHAAWNALARLELLLMEAEQTPPAPPEPDPPQGHVIARGWAKVWTLRGR